MSDFEWDASKDRVNRAKHGVGFELAQRAFLDPKRVIAEDLDHSLTEARYFCFGMIEDAVLTVRFTRRGARIRIFGAGYWRKGKAIYEKASGKKNERLDIREAKSGRCGSSRTFCRRRTISSFGRTM